MANTTDATREIAALAAEAYLWGYPLVLSDLTFIALASHGAAPGGEIGYNRFTHLRSFPDASFTDVVSPNADTLYSTAILDLRDYPVMLSLPEMGSRYYLMPLMDAWTNVFASPGTRTTGNGAGRFFIVGPRWQGRAPEGATLLRSPTSRAALIGRTQTNGKPDYEAVRALQDRYRLDVDHSYCPPRAPAVGEPPKEALERLDAASFFTRLCRLLGEEGALPSDSPLLERLRVLGVVPGRPFAQDALAPAVWAAVVKGYAEAKTRLETGERLGSLRRGAWSVSPAHLGNYGTDYAFRAAVARFGWGANLTADTVYPSARTDDSGAPLSGEKNYVLRFAPGQLPPVKAFWSISLYNARQFFAANPIDRYALGDRDPLALNADGSLEIYVRRDSPGPAHEANWLPSPPGPFNLIMRLYWPDQTILSGSWPMPTIREAPAP